MEKLTSPETKQNRPSDESNKRIETELKDPEARSAALNTVMRMHNGGAAELKPGIIPELTLGTSAAPEQIKEYQVKNGDSIWKIARGLLKEQHEPQSAQSVREMVHLILETNKERYPQLQKNPHMIDSSMSLIVPHLDKQVPHERLGHKDAQHQQEGQAQPGKHLEQGKHAPVLDLTKGLAHEADYPVHARTISHHPHPPHESQHQGREQKSEKHHEATDSSSGSNRDSEHKTADHHPKHLTAPESKEQHTIASWYGAWFNGRKTSNGERYDINKMTAAHKTLPFGTMVEVTNPINHHSVIVRINDRGPFVPGRGLDLTPMAARKLGTYGSGIANVNYKVVGYKS